MIYRIRQQEIAKINIFLKIFSLVITDSVRLTTAFGSDHPVVSRSGRKSNLIVYMYVYMRAKIIVCSV